MRRFILLAFGMLLLAGCGSNTDSSPTATPAPTAAPQATSAGGKHTPVAAPPTPAPTVTVSRDYMGFVNTICHAFAARDATTIVKSLPYYQYNSGLRYGTLGDGEGQTSDPSLMTTWLGSTRVACIAYTPDNAGHGTVLADGWSQPGGSALIELDTFNGQWKINDFTFGTRAALHYAMQTSSPILTYHS